VRDPDQASANGRRSAMVLKKAVAKKKTMLGP
jgi:hypothetical protein